MSSQRRDLLLKLCNDNAEAVTIAYHLTGYRRCDQIASWLIKQNLTGRTLVDWLKINWEMSMLSMVKYVLKKIDSDVTVRPILFGKDFN